jgi:hypothetical protein
LWIGKIALPPIIQQASWLVVVTNLLWCFAWVRSNLYVGMSQKRLSAKILHNTTWTRGKGKFLHCKYGFTINNSRLLLTCCYEWQIIALATSHGLIWLTQDFPVSTPLWLLGVLACAPRFYIRYCCTCKNL